MTHARRNYPVKLGQITAQVYGVTVEDAPTNVLIWSAERIQDKAEARAELRRANKVRERMGRPLAYPDFGTHAF